jgi:thioesterase domain-containing protein
VRRTGEIMRAAVAYGHRQLYVASAGIVRRRGLEQHEVYLHLHTRLTRGHLVETYRGRTVLLASAQYMRDTKEVLDRVVPPETADGNRHDVAVFGEHLDLLREPNVATVAHALDIELALAADERQT